MKILSLINSFIIDHLHLIIAALISYFFGILLIGYSFTVAVLLLLCIALMIFFIKYPKSFIYLLLLFQPVLPLFLQFFSLRPEGNEYLSVNLGGIIYGFSFIFLLCLLLLEKPRIFQYKLTIPILLFLCSLAVCIFKSQHFLWAFRYFIRYGMSALLYFAILSKFKDYKDAKRLLKFALIFFIIPIIYGHILFFTHSGNIDFYHAKAIDVLTETGDYRLGGGGVLHPNSFGILLVQYLLLAVYFIFDSQVRHRWGYLFLAMNMVFLLFVTWARGAWASFAGAFSVMGVLRNLKIYVVLLFSVFFLLVTIPSLTYKIVKRWQESGSVKSRFEVWKVGWELFLEKPILGHGLGAIEVKTTSLRTLTEQIVTKKSVSYGVGGTMAHNEYLRWLADGGVIALFIYLFLMFSCFKLSVQLIKLPHPSAKNYGAFLMAVVLSILIIGISDHGFQSLHFYFWTFVAVGEVYLRDLQSKSPNI